MKRLIVAIDCDDVLIRSTHYIVDAYNRLYGTSVQMGEAHTSSNPDWQADREEVHRRLSGIQLSEEYGRLAPMGQAIGAVMKLAERHELHLVTARAEEIESVTQQMIERHFPGCFTSIEHVGYDATKKTICRRIKADILIDDNLKHLLDAHTVGVPNLLWFGRYPWQDRTTTPEGVDVAEGWGQVTRRIEELSHE